MMYNVHLDLVPRSCFGGSRTKKMGEGKEEEEMRSGKI